MEPEAVKFKIKEHVKVEKFEGGLVKGTGQEPIEVIELEDGKIISHFKADAKEP